MTPPSLQGKTAIVTGANRGIGHAIAVALAREGVRVGQLSRTPAQIDGELCFQACDLEDLERVPAAVEALVRQLGGVDFLINNAGVFLEKTVAETPLPDWDRVLRVNLTAPFLICREVLPHMIGRGQGKIVNIASTSSVQGYAQQAAYCASKHGLLGFARCLAIEAKPHNIHVYDLCPGGVETDLIKGTELGQRLQGQPMIAPNDIAELTVFLLKQPGRLDLPEVIVRRFA